MIGYDTGVVPEAGTHREVDNVGLPSCLLSIVHHRLVELDEFRVTDGKLNQREMECEMSVYADISSLLSDTH